MTKEEKKEKVERAWVEYATKLNNFVDWLTALIISNFAFLITNRTDEAAWQIGFYASTISLTIIFLIKILGVRAVQIRVEAIERDMPFEDTPENKIENIRDLISTFFVILGPMSLGASGVILKINIWLVSILTVLIFVIVCCACQLNMRDIKKIIKL